MATRSSFPFAVATVFCITLAAAVRLPALGLRVMHGDEAVHAWKLEELVRTGVYRYDPQEYHGPTLYDFTLPAVVLAGGTEDFGRVDEATLRMVPAVFGIATVALVALLRPALGTTATVLAMLALAASPVLSFYARYYIQETLLGFFVLAMIVCAWRFLRGGRPRWAAAAGAAAGLAHATKETVVLAWAAMAVAALFVAYRRGVSRRVGRGAVVGLIVAAVVSSAFYSSFGRHPQGMVDAWRAWAVYLRRGGDPTHRHPAWYYLSLYWGVHRGAVALGSEGVWFALGIGGCLWVLSRAAKGRRHEGTEVRREVRAQGAGRSARESVPTLPRSHLRTVGPSRATGPHGAHGEPGTLVAVGDGGFVRFLAVYVLALTAMYWAIPYKTPWCAVQFVGPMLIMAGWCAARLIDARQVPGVVRWGGIAVAVVALASMPTQAVAVNLKLAHDDRNPLRYAHPTRDVVRLARYVQRLAAVHPDGRRMLVQVISRNCWPLPWYLRSLERVGYWEQVPELLPAAVVIADAELAERIGALRQNDVVSYYGLRRDQVMAVFVERGLWERFAASQPAGRAEP